MSMEYISLLHLYYQRNGKFKCLLIYFKVTTAIHLVIPESNGNIAGRQEEFYMTRK